MKFIWRRYQGSKIIGEGVIEAECRVRAKALVMKASQTGGWRKQWHEHQFGVIKSYHDMRGRFLMNQQTSSFVVFFEPENEDAMIQSLTHPENRGAEQQTLFEV